MSERAGESFGTLRAYIGNWRQNIIYIGFVVIFIVFALTLKDKGF